MAVAALAQQVTTSKPFFLRVHPTNQKLNKAYLTACHAGAATEGLCVDPATQPPSAASNSSIFYFNQTSSGGSLSPTGTLTWNLPVGGSDRSTAVSEPLTLLLDNPGSNVVVPLFLPTANTNTAFGFDSNSTLYIEAINDSNSKKGQQPVQQTVKLYHWYICWAMTGGYYYNSLAWVTAGTPHNPTCQKALGCKGKKVA
ncbi:hypothetical protein GQ53DRAFT_766988 [Thozetella sp. PMI_491]|nr:hypothetical protein GQ53DRAFT_766988 [Thozetella sp. PMI_491]